jgi:hypothetical protein
MSVRPPAPNVGRFTGIILGFVVFVCVAMIGCTGYLKYQLDRAETTLAAPDNALGSDQDLFVRLRRDLGYGGFLGLAQNYALTHDASGFAEMKAHIKSADDIIAHLPDKTPAEMRHELASIVAAYDSALQKISAPAGELNGEFTAADLAPLYASLPILDARVTAGNAETRLAAQNQMQFWAMLLTLASWCSLIIAAACAAGIYLTLRDKHSAPMRALAQSIQNMARGDMRTAIWGTERQDMIGELARAVDIARYHFSHLPDLSLISEQGPVRMRFEGGSRSLFEAMMKAISRDSENIREHSSSLVGIVNSQKESISELTQKVETVLRNIIQRGENGDHEIGKAIHDMLGSAENLKNAHAHAADQLNRLIPSLEERTQGLAEIAHITGKQIGQTMQSLTASEAGMKANAEHARETLVKLSSTADDLGERLFGAINLLQASGKVLAETTDDIKGRFGEQAASGKQMAADLTPLTQRLEYITVQLAAMQAKLTEHGDAQADIVAALEQQMERGDAAPAVMPTAALDVEALAPLTDKLEHIAAQIGKMQTELAQQENMATVIEQSLAHSEAAQKNATLMAINDMETRIASLAANIPADLRQHINKELQDLAGQIGTNIAQKIDIVQNALAEQSGLAATIEHSLVRKEEVQKAATLTAIAALEDKIATMAASIPAELRQNLHSELQDLAAHIDAAQGQVVQVIDERTTGSMTRLSTKIDTMHAELTKPTLPLEVPPELIRQLNDHWYQMAAQIEATRTGIDKILQQKVIGKLEAFEQTLETTKNAAEATRFEMVQPPKPQTYTLPPELQQQLLDQWFQMSAQLEASRANMVEAIADQIDKMETRLAGRAGNNNLSKTAADYATQRQIEQQTQILSELVATLGVLDAHMQQMKAEMRAGG